MKKFKESQPNWASLLAIFAVAVIMGANTSANSVLSKIMQSFPDVATTTVRLISTLPSVVSTIVTLLIGPFIGKKLGYRTTCIMGAICYVLGGFAPVFLNQSIILILLCRAVFGVGFGLLACRTGYVMLMSKGDNKAEQTATMTMITNASGVVLGLLAGYLGDISWRLAFAPFALGIIPIIMVITMLKEPPKSEEDALTDNSAEVAVTKAKISPRTYLYSAFTFFSSIVGLTWMTGMSSLLMEKGSESSTQVSLILVGCQVGSLFGSMLFKKLNRQNTRYMAFYVSVISAIGAVMVIVFNNIVLMFLAGCVAGMGFVMGMVMCNAYAGLSNERSKMTQATTIVIAFSAVATFFTSYYIDICGKLLGGIAPTFTSASFIVSTGIMVVMAVVTFFIDFGPKKPIAEQQA